MNITELKAAVDLAVERGIHPETTVVVALEGWYALLDADVCDPTVNDEGGYIWFTLNPAAPTQVGDRYEWADARFTPDHQPHYTQGSE